MLNQKSKKIFLYFFIFLVIGSLNNKNFEFIDLFKVDKIIVTGLNKESNYELYESLNFLKKDNLLFLSKNKIKDILSSNSLVEKHFIFKRYPSTLDIKVYQTKFLAKIIKNNENFYLGSNGKLTKIINSKIELPIIFGDFSNQSFFELKKAIDQTNFEYDEIKRLFFFKSGRWDIETKKGLLIKLPKNQIQNSLKLVISFLSNSLENDVSLIDLRQNNQIIVNE